jgi:hypothetical protein
MVTPRHARTRTKMPLLHIAIKHTQHELLYRYDPTGKLRIWYSISKSIVACRCVDAVLGGCWEQQCDSILFWNDWLSCLTQLAVVNLLRQSTSIPKLLLPQFQRND